MQTTPETSSTLQIINLVLTFLVTFLTSSGLWAYILKRKEQKSFANELLLGLAHDRIVTVGLTYIDRGNVTQDEYENLCFLYAPYVNMGGNGTAKRIMAQVDNLPICRERVRKTTGELKNDSVR